MPDYTLLKEVTYILVGLLKALGEVVAPCQVDFSRLPMTSFLADSILGDVKGM